MRLAILLTSTVIMMLLSCSESENPQPKCETYYLRSLGGSPEAHYYSNGLISEYIMDIDTIARFEYYPNNLLRLRKSNEYSVYYFYDGEGRLMYALDYKNDALRDSITFEYNPQNLISAINHYTRLNFILQRTERNEYDYAGKNSTQVRFYDLDSNNLPNLILTGTFLFEFDNKKIPFPKETWPFYYVLDNGSISENNVIKQTVRKEGLPDSETIYTYKYNSDGLPTELKIGDFILQQYIYSCEPIIRGTK